MYVHTYINWSRAITRSCRGTQMICQGRTDGITFCSGPSVTAGLELYFFFFFFCLQAALLQKLPKILEGVCLLHFLIWWRRTFDPAFPIWGPGNMYDSTASVTNQVREESKREKKEKKQASICRVYNSKAFAGAAEKAGWLAPCMLCPTTTTITTASIICYRSRNSTYTDNIYFSRNSLLPGFQYMNAIQLADSGGR